MPCSLGQLQSIVADLAAQSAIAGFVSGAVASGTFKGAVQGSFTALVFYGTGQAFGQVTVNGAVDPDLLAQAVAARAVAGCVTSVAGGGKCGPGALSAVFSKLATPITGQINAVAGTVVSAVIGGTAAELGGGKFANGAVTGAFGYLFNCLSHPGTCNKEDIPEIREAMAKCNALDSGCVGPLADMYREAGGQGAPRVSMWQALKDFLGIGMSGAVGPVVRIAAEGVLTVDVAIQTGHWASRAERYGFDVAAINNAIVADVSAMVPNLSQGAWFFGRVEVGGTLFRYSAMLKDQVVRVTTVYSPGKW